MATTERKIVYIASQTYTDEDGNPSSAVIRIEKVDSTRRMSSDRRQLGIPKREHTTIVDLSPMEAYRLAEQITESLATMAAESLVWAKQLEDANIDPEYIV